jgi:hypothetical protein
VRFVIEQYRDDLIAQLRGSADVRSIEEHEQAVAEGREAVASDLLNVLHSIPIQSIATNGPSLVHKVRFVASTLLDAVRKADTAPASAARAHAYLCASSHHRCLLILQLTRVNRRGLLINPLRDRKELPVSIPRRNGLEIDSDIAHACSLDDDRDGGSSGDSGVILS